MTIHSDENALKAALVADAKTAKLVSGTWTVATTASIDIPVTAIGFRIYPTSNSIRFAVGEAPVAAGSGSLTAGGIAKNDMWETRLLVDGEGRTLQLLSTASTVVEVEIF